MGKRLVSTRRKKNSTRRPSNERKLIMATIDEHVEVQLQEFLEHNENVPDSAIFDMRTSLRDRMRRQYLAL